MNNHEDLPPLPEGDYRFLDPQDVIQETDLFWSGGCGPWTNFSVNGCNYGPGQSYRDGSWVPMCREIAPLATLQVEEPEELARFGS